MASDAPRSDGTQPITDLWNARRLIETHGTELRHAPQLGAWLVWDGRRWAEDVTGEAVRRAKRVIDDLREVVFSDEEPSAQRRRLAAWQRAQQAGRIDGLLRLASTEPGVPVLVSNLDADPWLLNVANGTLDLRSGELREHRRGDLITKLIDVDFDPDATAPTFERVLERVLPDRDVRSFTQRALGSALTGDVSDQVLNLAHGDGANGKSTILNLVRRLLADYAVQLAPDVLWTSARDQHPTGLTDLRGARLAVTIEVEQGRGLAESLVKSLTGGEPIRARRMRCDYFEFAPTHTIFVACNHLPVVRGADDGIWRRLVVIPFLVTIPPAERDPHLPERLWAEREGVLAWLVAGCLAWQRDGLSPPPTITATTESYRVEQDHLGGFLAARCEFGSSYQAATGDLRLAYETWCEQAGAEPLSRTMFGRMLGDRGIPASRDKRHRQGLQLKPGRPSGSDDETPQELGDNACATTPAQFAEVPPNDPRVRAHDERSGKPPQLPRGRVIDDREALEAQKAAAYERLFGPTGAQAVRTLEDVLGAVEVNAVEERSHG